jgi:predicted transcriptional regulator
MQKSMYSLMLMDRVVKAIDEMASSMNTNRSNLVNQVLADRAGKKL